MKDCVRGAGGWRQGGGSRWGAPSVAAGTARWPGALGALLLSARRLGAGRPGARGGATGGGLADDAGHGLAGRSGRSDQRGGVLFGDRGVRGRLFAGARVGRSAGGSCSFSAFLRGPAGGPRSCLCCGRRCSLRASRRGLGGDAGARRGRRGGSPASASPDARARGRLAHLSFAADRRSAARHRARLPACARGGAAASGLAARPPLGAAAAPLGARLRTADRAAGRRGRSRRPARSRALPTLWSCQRRRA
jgi:hypothetical protein